jgi:UDP-glucose 4-epimerase
LRHCPLGEFSGINLIAAAVRHGVECFILAFGTDVYGAPARIPIIESELIAPRSPYGESLYTLERALRWYERIAELRFAVLLQRGRWH